jgi:dTDP-4-dehydrorhamnose 3,5-epimerase
VRLEPTSIEGVQLVHLEPVQDDRGAFVRTFDADAFADAGITPIFSQASVSVNRSVHTLRGMHLQAPPFEETKLVRCSRGKVFDVVVDARPTSSTYGAWLSFELSPQRPIEVAIGPGIAHGFMTLAPDSEVTYLISARYSPTHAIGFRWNDPLVAIDWPTTPVIMSARDSSFPDLSEMSRG